MKKRILQLLRETPGGFISGEEISRQLAVSRTAVWKHIAALKRDGYEIEAHPRRGYCLQKVPDLLLPEEVQAGLATQSIGRNIVYFRSTDSTNQEAKKQAAAGCPEGTVVIAEEQTGGRGRLSRSFISPAGQGIWLSVVLRPPFQPFEAPKCTLMAAVAVTRAIYNLLGVRCGIKWPNDIMYAGKKLVGILTEMSAEIDIINYIIIGIGINVNINKQDFPPEVAANITSLSAATGGFVSRLALVQAELRELEKTYQQVLNGGFPAILDEWRTFSATLGQEVVVTGLAKKFTGRAVDIDGDGNLLVRTARGLERVVAGDVSIRAAGGRREE